MILYSTVNMMLELYDLNLITQKWLEVVLFAPCFIDCIWGEEAFFLRRDLELHLFSRTFIGINTWSRNLPRSIDGCNEDLNLIVVIQNETIEKDLLNVLWVHWPCPCWWNFNLVQRLYILNCNLVVTKQLFIHIN